MNLKKREEVVKMIDEHFSTYGNATRFVEWAAKKGVKIHHSLITRAKQGGVSSFSALAFLVYLEEIGEYNPATEPATEK